MKAGAKKERAVERSQPLPSLALQRGSWEDKSPTALYSPPPIFAKASSWYQVPFSVLTYLCPFFTYVTTKAQRG